MVANMLTYVAGCACSECRDPSAYAWPGAAECQFCLIADFGTLLRKTKPYSLHCLGLIRQSTRGFKLRIGALLIACLVAASGALPRRLVSLQ